MSKREKEGMNPRRLAFQNAIDYIRDQWDWYDMTPKAVSTGLVLAAGLAVGLPASCAMHHSQNVKNLNSTIREVTRTYGDKNSDGYISREEKDVLFREILESFGNPDLKMVTGEMPYNIKTGEEISNDEFSAQIRSFMDSKTISK